VNALAENMAGTVIPYTIKILEITQAMEDTVENMVVDIVILTKSIDIAFHI
jgi:hypothetical protein